MVVVLQSQLDAGRTLFLGAPPSLRAWRKPLTYGLHCASRSHYIISPQFTRTEQGETKGGLDNPKFASS